MKLNIIKSEKSYINPDFNKQNWLYLAINCLNDWDLSDEIEYFNNLMIFKR